MTPPVTGLVPMIPVRDPERSVAFYRHLGFEVGNRVPKDGPLGWAWLYAPGVDDWRRGPNLMLTSSDTVPLPPAPGILFYLYASDLAALRTSLQQAGLAPGPIRYPDYLPEGEFELRDPDGYCLMVAQSTGDTP